MLLRAVDPDAAGSTSRSHPIRPPLSPARSRSRAPARPPGRLRRVRRHLAAMVALVAVAAAVPSRSTATASSGTPSTDAGSPSARAACAGAGPSSIPMPRSPSSCEARRARGAPDSPRSASTSARAQGHAGRSTSARSRPPSSFVACGRSSSSRSCPTRWRGFRPTRSAAQRRRGRDGRVRAAAAKDDPAPTQVCERDAPGVHEAGEGPGREEQPGGDGVRLEEEGAPAIRSGSGSKVRTPRNQGLTVSR